MTVAEWLEQRWYWCEQYPLPPIDKHFRLDLELANPHAFLPHIKLDFNPHIGYDANECFYVNDNDWSTIFNVCEIDDKLRMLVECGHDKPLGEPIRLLSTSSSFVHESWAARKNWHDFAFFRGMWWKVTWNEYFSGYPFGGHSHPAVRDRRYYDPDVRDSERSGIMAGINEHWLSSTVLDLAYLIQSEYDFSRMPMLADALMDAGCDDNEMIHHCMQTEHQHTRWCWVLRSILRRPEGLSPWERWPMWNATTRNVRVRPRTPLDFVNLALHRHYN